MSPLCCLIVLHKTESPPKRGQSSELVQSAEEIVSNEIHLRGGIGHSATSGRVLVGVTCSSVSSVGMGRSISYNCHNIFLSGLL